MVDRTATDTLPDPRADAAPPRAPLADDEASPGDARRIGRFAVLERIGEGGMGTVVAAYDPELDRRVALKLVRPDRWRSGSAVARQRMLGEARAMARVSHPNVVTVYEIGELDDGIYVAMEFVHGETIRQWLARRSRRWPEIVEVFVQLARGIEAVHAAGLVHRDIKPDNLMIRDDGRAQVLDFGIARVLEVPGADAGSGEPTLHTGLTTEHGALAGTPAYMAPEQFGGFPADARTDQWSLCVTLFEALYGRRPFTGADVYELAAAVTSGAMVPAVKERGVPPAVHDVVLRGLAALPGDRWPSIHDLADALARAGGRRGRRRRAAGILAALIATGGIAAMASRDRPSCDDVGDALARVWDRERRDRIGERFGQQSPGAGAEVWTYTAERVDAYGNAWIAAERDACEAATVTHLQSSQVFDLRRRCLERGLYRLDATLAALEGADLEGLESGIAAVGVLPAVSECADVETLLAGPAPAAPELADEVDGLTRRLDEIEAQLAINPDHGIVDRVDALAGEITRVGYPPLTARFQLLRAGALDDDSDDVVARAAHEDAYFLARSADDHATAAFAACRIAFLSSRIPDARESSSTWLQLAEAELDEHATSEMKMAVANARGAVFLGEGRSEQAIAAFHDAIAELDTDPSSIVEPELERSTIFNNIASAYLVAGRSREAVPWAEEAVTLERRVYGDAHPGRAVALGVLGSALAGTGDYPRALAVLNEVLALREGYFGADHPLVGLALVRLASTIDEYDPTQVEVMCGRALRIFEQAYGPDSVPSAYCHNMLGHARTTRQDLVGARDEFRTGLTIMERGLGPEHPQTGGAMFALGTAELKLRNYDAAESWLQKGVAVAEANGTADSPGLAYALGSLGQIRLETNRAVEAIPLFERALALHEANGAAAEVRASTTFFLARALVDRDPDRARSLAARARADYAAANPPRHERVAIVDAWLAEHPARR